MTGSNRLPAGVRLTEPTVLLATWFGVGLFPRAPGTWGALAALPIAWLIRSGWGWPGLAVAVVVVTIAGVWASASYIKASGQEDPAPVVVDEVAGQWLTLIVVEPDLVLYGIGFVLFRIADIVKPWPVSWADRQVKGGLGVMLDDLLAALYAGAALYVVDYLMGR